MSSDASDRLAGAPSSPSSATITTSSMSSASIPAACRHAPIARSGAPPVVW
jgi:hypothetical protein